MTSAVEIQTLNNWTAGKPQSSLLFYISLDFLFQFNFSSLLFFQEGYFFPKFYNLLAQCSCSQYPLMLLFYFWKSIIIVYILFLIFCQFEPSLFSFFLAGYKGFAIYINLLSKASHQSYCFSSCFSISVSLISTLKNADYFLYLPAVWFSMPLFSPVSYGRSQAIDLQSFLFLVDGTDLNIFVTAEFTASHQVWYIISSFSFISRSIFFVISLAIACIGVYCLISSYLGIF